jgi:hypothetical protein
LRPNGWRLSGAEGVRCSRGLGHEHLLANELKRRLLDLGSFWVSGLPSRCKLHPVKKDTGRVDSDVVPVASESMSDLMALDVLGRIGNSPNLPRLKIVSRADSNESAHAKSVISHGCSFAWPNGWRLSGEPAARVRCSRGLGRSRATAMCRIRTSPRQKPRTTIPRVHRLLPMPPTTDKV